MAFLAAEKAIMKVGMVGIGGMGKRIAINIANAGFEFTVNDLREAPMKELEQLGALGQGEIGDDRPGGRRGRIV